MGFGPAVTQYRVNFAWAAITLADRLGPLNIKTLALKCGAEPGELLAILYDGRPCGWNSGLWHRPDIGSMLCQRQRRWRSNEPILVRFSVWRATPVGHPTRSDHSLDHDSPPSARGAKVSNDNCIVEALGEVDFQVVAQSLSLLTWLHTCYITFPLHNSVSNECGVVSRSKTYAQFYYAQLKTRLRALALYEQLIWIKTNAKCVEAVCIHFFS